MKYSPKKIGLAQAIGLALYISVFAAAAHQIGQWLAERNIGPHPITNIILFLSTFVISALICGSIVFAYPVSIFFDGKRKEAFKIIFWNAVWLIAFIILFAIGALIIWLK